jgi:hypothetical protein
VYPKSPCFCPSWSLRYEFRQSFAPGKTDSNAGCRQFATVPETADASAQQNEGVALLNLNAVCLCGLDCQVSAVSSDCGWQLAASRFTWRAAHFSISDSPGVERHVSASTQNQAFVLSCFLIDRCLNWIRDAWMESVQRDRSECRLFCHTTKFAGFWRRVRLFVPHNVAGEEKYSTLGTKCCPLAGQKAQRRQANPECLRPRLRFCPHYEATRICNHADQFIETRRCVRKLSTFGNGINGLPF